MKIERVKTEDLAKKVENFLINALSPEGFAYMPMPIATLKDRLAWLTWANLMRSEQPTFVAMENETIIGVIIGEPIETTFDIGESEIQDIVILPQYETEELTENLMKPIIEFYKENNAKQVHVWCLKEKYENKDLNLKCKIATEKFGFKYCGFERVSKWLNKPIVKLELYFGKALRDTFKHLL